MVTLLLLDFVSYACKRIPFRQASTIRTLVALGVPASTKVPIDTHTIRKKNTISHAWIERNKTKHVLLVRNRTLDLIHVLPRNPI